MKYIHGPRERRFDALLKFDKFRRTAAQSVDY